MPRKSQDKGSGDDANSSRLSRDQSASRSRRNFPGMLGGLLFAMFGEDVEIIHMRQSSTTNFTPQQLLVANFIMLQCYLNLNKEHSQKRWNLVVYLNTIDRHFAKQYASFLDNPVCVHVLSYLNFLTFSEGLEGIHRNAASCDDEKFQDESLRQSSVWSENKAILALFFNEDYANTSLKLKALKILLTDISQILVTPSKPLTTCMKELSPLIIKAMPKMENIGRALKYLQPDTPHRSHCLFGGDHGVIASPPLTPRLLMCLLKNPNYAVEIAHFTTEIFAAIGKQRFSEA